MSDELTPEEAEQVRQSREDIKAGRYRTFASADEYIKSLEDDD